MDKRMVYVIINLFIISVICTFVKDNLLVLMLGFMPVNYSIFYIMEMCKGRNKQSIYVLLDKLYYKKK